MKIKASMRDYGHKMAVPTYISTYICKISIYICNTDKMRVIQLQDNGMACPCW